MSAECGPGESEAGRAERLREEVRARVGRMLGNAPLFASPTKSALRAPWASPSRNLAQSPALLRCEVKERTLRARLNFDPSALADERPSLSKLPRVDDESVIEKFETVTSSDLEEDELGLHLGARVQIEINGFLCTGEVRFIGETHFSGTSTIIGLEMDSSQDVDEAPGSVDGIHYFDGSHGRFVAQSEICKIVDELPASTFPDCQESGEKTSSSQKNNSTFRPPSEAEEDLSGGEIEGASGAKQPSPAQSSWAFGDDFSRAVEAQYSAEKPAVDPDAIFQFEVGGECDLVAIFNRASASYSKRYSTGEWAQDGLSVTEELVYKRDAGHLTLTARDLASTP